MKYLIGIDGGGTKTKCVVTDIAMTKVFECFGGPSNFLIAGTEKVSETLSDLIDQSKNALNCSYEDFAAIVLGTTGAGRRGDAETLENDFGKFCLQKGIKIKNFRVESDARIALEGAFSGKPGSILIAGTGSIMFGKDAEGNIHRVGGFGRFLGDEGSGYTIGRLGLTAVSKQFDGRGEETAITKLLAEKLNIETPEALITAVYKNNFDIATVAPLVIEAASSGDKAASAIVEQQTDELILHLASMIKKINRPVMDVSFIGGIICNDHVFSKLFKEKIASRLPAVNIKNPDFPPEMGAVVMAKQLADK
jgi:N-acetylglucosamine kinase-like BadF-type ATPase